MDYCKEGPPRVETLADLLDELRKIFDQKDVDVDYVKEVMLSYRSNVKEWKKYAFFDRHRYTRNLVDAGNGKYNIMLLAWSEGQGSSIHDHSNAHCFMKILSGSLTEIRYAWPEIKEEDSGEDNIEGMKILEENELCTNDVAYINDALGLHRVENRSHTSPAVSLHVYIPPFNTCRTFDQRTGHSNQVQFTFHSMGGKRTPFKGVHNGSDLLCFENN